MGFWKPIKRNIMKNKKQILSNINKNVEMFIDSQKGKKNVVQTLFIKVEYNNGNFSVKDRSGKIKKVIQHTPIQPITDEKIWKKVLSVNLKTKEKGCKEIISIIYNSETKTMTVSDLRNKLAELQLDQYFIRNFMYRMQGFNSTLIRRTGCFFSSTDPWNKQNCVNKIYCLTSKIF